MLLEVFQSQKPGFNVASSYMDMLHNQNPFESHILTITPQSQTSHCIYNPVSLWEIIPIRIHLPKFSILMHFTLPPANAAKPLLKQMTQHSLVHHPPPY